MKLKKIILENSFSEKNYSARDYKFTWKREKATTGRWKSFDNNDLRGYNLKINNKKFGNDEVAFISNVSHGMFDDDTSKQWSIWFFAKGHNIQFKKRFELNDVENAKRFCEALFVQIMNSDNNDIKNRILALGRINREMY